MAENPPYLVSPGSIKKAFEKIKAAPPPPRFNGDFVETVIGIKGGSGRALIPFFKRIGLVKADGSPSDLYIRFRNPATSGKAIAEAFRGGFKSLYQLNEYIHQAKDEDVRNAIIQATGLAHDDRVVSAIFGTFKTLRAYADFGENGSIKPTEAVTQEERGQDEEELEQSFGEGIRRLNLSYTINLNLPASDDIRVFDAIFRSLKENLLKD